MHKYMYGVIGYRNHSKKLLDILKNITNKEIIVYVHKKLSVDIKIGNKNINYTNELEALNKCRAIIIASPSKTHFKYLKYFSNKKKYIFCEKPGVINNLELNNIKRFNLSKRKLTYFNFNYTYSEIIEPIKKAIKNKKYGKLLYIYIQSSHGLYFKNDKFKKNRFNKNNIYENIYGNLGVHYISLLSVLFKKIEIENISLASFNSKGEIDTANVTILLNKKIKVNLFLSYSTIYTQKISMFFNNASVEYENNKIIEFYPRDTFNQKGNFIKPIGKIIKDNVSITKNTNENSLKYFTSKVEGNKKLDLLSFNKMLEFNKLLINSSKKINFQNL